jgi:hypothetical protein
MHELRFDQRLQLKVATKKRVLHPWRFYAADGHPFTFRCAIRKVAI